MSVSPSTSSHHHAARREEELVWSVVGMGFRPYITYVAMMIDNPILIKVR
jgi:hypothetical protein